MDDKIRAELLEKAQSMAESLEGMFGYATVETDWHRDGDIFVVRRWSGEIDFRDDGMSFDEICILE